MRFQFHALEVDTPYSAPSALDRICEILTWGVAPGFHISHPWCFEIHFQRSHCPQLIYLVDNTIDEKGASPREILDALARIRPDTEVIRDSFQDVSLRRVEELAPTHIILSGQSHPWDNYSPESLAGVFDVIHNARQPILGVCGGHQQIAIAYAAPVDVMKRLGPGVGYENCLRERGYFDIETDSEGIFAGLPIRLEVWHSHFDEVKKLPEGFKTTASNKTCAIQAMQHTSRPVYGVQFHPELFDDQHPDGRSVVKNFLDL